MADQLATPQDLASLLGLDWSTLSAADKARLTLLVEAATAVVQAAAGQRIVQVVDDEMTIMGTSSRWLELPQRPVTAVESVSINGQAITDYDRYGARLFRPCGWAPCPTEPSTVVVVNTHGYPPGSQDLELARSAVLGLAQGPAANPSGATSEAIDDYRVSFDAAAAKMQVTDWLRNALRSKYGYRAGLVRLG